MCERIIVRKQIMKRKKGVRKIERRKIKQKTRERKI